MAGGEHGPNFGPDGKPHPALPNVFDQTVAWLDAHLKRAPGSANTRRVRGDWTMTDWQFAQTDPSEDFAKLHLFSMQKRQPTGDVEFIITVFDTSVGITST